MRNTHIRSKGSRFWANSVFFPVAIYPACAYHFWEGISRIKVKKSRGPVSGLLMEAAPSRVLKGKKHENFFQ
ncbi:hypothetical protein DFP90_101305 [Aestuariispira insulae]|uniref:Uncharacterized protein n=1 Tax=Aestuariispira insulae TaxID=1461337 RepID=A0A3D9HVG7_9PROT|nr:hypothetical protein DFP90_101305 [Aestuariispira insulae]